MALDGNFRPTLLVGLGGTGSRIVESILSQALEANPELAGRIGVLAIDTDMNDMRELKNIPKSARLQISAPETVNRIIERNSEVEKDWCYPRNAPEMKDAIRGMTLIEGAGMIRMMTRLALHDSIRNRNLLGKLQQAISDLAVHAHENDYAGAIHILVVGSFAGATGSGSFAQVALALKDAARDRNVSATVRGVFLLPDVYARSGVLQSKQQANVLANGYASLKELNAINQATIHGRRRAAFRFEYLPDRDIQRGGKPYEAITFIDFENSRGGSMGRNLEGYVSMAARAGYLMIFSPLGARYGSVTINDVRQRLSDATNIYSGIGVAAVKYPVDSTRRYLARRLVRDMLQGDWLRLDRAYRSQLERHRQDVAAGRTGAEPPDIRETYIRDLAQLAREEPRIAFYRNAHDYLFPEIENEKSGERTVRPRHAAFADELVAYVEREFWSDSRTKDIRARPEIDSSALIEGDSLVDSVRRAESDLDRDWRTLEAALQGGPEDIFLNAIVTADGLGPGEWALHHIQRYIIDSSPHPVTVRAFLYHLRKELEQRRAAVTPRDIRLRLYKLANQFKDSDELSSEGQTGPASRSTGRVIERATEAEGGGVLGGLFQRRKKAFAANYAEYHGNSLRMMRAYAAAVIAQKTCEQALSEVNALIRAFEGLFSEIETIMKRLETEIARERDGYSQRSSFDGNAFVYADADCKEDAWARLSEVAAGRRLDDAVNARLVRSVHTKHREDRRNRRPSDFNDINALFWEQVVEGFGQRAVDSDYGSVFDISVIEAMRRERDVLIARAAREAAARGAAAPHETSHAEFMRNTVRRAATQSEPYLSFVNPDSDGEGIKFWTVHPQAREDLDDEALFAEMFRSADGDDPIVKPEFSRYELICMNIRVNVELRHLAKLQVGAQDAETVYEAVEGRLARAYNALVAPMLAAERKGAGGEFTPHIDRSWHIPGVLPEIFDEESGRLDERIAKAFVVARAHEFIRLDTEEKEPIARFVTIGRGLRSGRDEDVCRSHEPWTIYGAFAQRAQLVASAIEAWEGLLGAEASSAESHPSHGRLTDAVTLLELMKPSARRNADVETRDETTEALLHAWIGLLDEIFEAHSPALTPRGRKAALIAAVDDVRARLFSLATEEGYSPEIVRVFERVFGGAYDRRFAA